MNFRQFDNEHVAQAWERMKFMVKNCPTHGGQDNLQIRQSGTLKEGRARR